MSENKRPDYISVAADESLPASQAGILALAHVLVMNVFVVAVLIAGALGLSDVEGTQLIQSSFLGAGIATLIQVLFFLRLPVAQGASFVPLGAVIGIYVGTGSFSAVMGASLVASLAVFALGLSGLYKHVIRALIPNLVSGIIIMVIGLALMPTAFNSNIFISNDQLSIGQNIGLAGLTVLVLVATTLIGQYVKSLNRPMQYTSVIIALAVGTLAAQLMGGIDWSAVASAPWISMPLFAFIDYKLSFDPASIATMLIIFMVVLAETTGTWYAIASVSGEAIDDNRINRGVIGEGISNFINSLVGATPTASFSSNAGIIAITGVASRQVFVGVGILFIILAFFGKLSALINIIPTAVIGGIFAMVAFQIFMAGLNLVHPHLSDTRNQYVVGMSILVTLGVVLLPADIIAQTPNLVQYFLNSPIAMGALTAMLANQIFPQVKN
ncbi:xanthine/uracil permease [Aerococcus urinaehominis]|uniref:Xanthine/uracil permease n=1 Tax=Aerococcus urinaehominis TaxID=128944 RepID=A0A0X8FJR5_9LACT|nr:solute carrier family 23 protein [Aerococcus urinaehominis]AMB98567.1 xanthine/uracil permease [Aerococcus urinaehominis]SDL77703.1 uracil-xanthine permease [Aerococcus urinaehominis]